MICFESFNKKKKTGGNMSQFIDDITNNGLEKLFFGI